MREIFLSLEVNLLPFWSCQIFYQSFFFLFHSCRILHSKGRELTHLSHCSVASNVSRWHGCMVKIFLMDPNQIFCTSAESNWQRTFTRFCNLYSVIMPIIFQQFCQHTSTPLQPSSYASHTSYLIFIKVVWQTSNENLVWRVRHNSWNNTWHMNCGCFCRIKNWVSASGNAVLACRNREY